MLGPLTETVSVWPFSSVCFKINSSNRIRTKNAIPVRTKIGTLYGFKISTKDVNTHKAMKISSLSKTMFKSTDIKKT